MAIQVYEATKDGQGNSLPVLSRQFISFSYGGKNIEDFDLVAVFANNRLEKEVYSSFNDTTTNQAEIDGQLFWRSKYNANSLSFTLATDGMTSQELDSFKKWFIPGIERELILSEHHNRAILARVSAAPKISMIPFENEIDINIAGTVYKTRSSLYKGEITLSFTMDDPFWYSLAAIIDEITEESLKIIYEDNVPHFSMLKSECLLADNLYFNGSQVESNAGLTIDPDNQATDRYLYYCGTAKEKPTISFNVAPQVDNDSGMVSLGTSSLYHIKVGKNNFQFTLPPIFSSYNYALSIVSEFEGASILDLRSELRDELSDYYARAWAIKIIDEARNKNTYVSSAGEILTGFQDYFIEEMKKFFPENTAYSFEIDSKNGIATVSGEVGDYGFIEENCGNMIKSNYLIIEETTLPINGTINATQMLQVVSNISLTGLKIEYKYRYL